MTNLQAIASKVIDPATIWETKRQYPTGVAQDVILNALGITANNAGHANAIFAALGISVSSKHVGRRSVPVWDFTDNEDSQQNLYGDFDIAEANMTITLEDLKAIKEYIA